MHWNRSLQLDVSIKNHLLSLHTLWQEICSPFTHCDKTFVQKWHLLQPEIGWLTRRKWKFVKKLETRGWRNWRLIWTSLCRSGNEMSYHIQSLSSGIASGDDMLCLTRLENKVLKEYLAAKDAKKKQKSISHFFNKS